VQWWCGACCSLLVLLLLVSGGVLHVSRVDSCAYDAYYALLVGLERPTNH
jgi:hypothetical protein